MQPFPISQMDVWKSVQYQGDGVEYNDGNNNNLFKEELKYFFHLLN